MSFNILMDPKDKVSFTKPFYTVKCISDIKLFWIKSGFNQSATAFCFSMCISSLISFTKMTSLGGGTNILKSDYQYLCTLIDLKNQKSVINDVRFRFIPEISVCAVWFQQCKITVMVPCFGSAGN